MNRNRITLLNIASTIILQGLAFLSGPIFSSVLGTDNYGIAAVYLTWVQIASTVFSLQAGGMLAVARVNFPLEDQEKYQSSVLSLATVAYFCFSIATMGIVFVLSKWYTINTNMVALGLLHGWGLYCVGAMNAKYTYEFKAGRNFLLSVTTSALTIGVSVLLITLYPPEINYWGRIIGQTSVYAIIGAALIIHLFAKGKTFYNREYWSFTLPLTIPTIFHLLAFIVLNQSDKVMLKAIVGNSAAGIYALACTFAAVLNSIYHALNNSWVPFYYEYTRCNEISVLRKHASNYIELFTILTMGFILLSREVFHIYANKNFWDGTDLIPLFSIGYYFVFLYSFPVNYEFYNKKTKTIAIGTMGAALVNIILNYVFIKCWGIQGAVIATAASQAMQFGFHYINAKRITVSEFPFSMKDFIPGFVCVCGTCCIYWFTRELWLIRWGIGGLIGCYLVLKVIRRKEIF